MPQYSALLLRFILITFSVLVSAVFTTANAMPSLRVDDNLTLSNISPVVQYHADTTTGMTLEQVKALPDSAWGKTNAKALSFGFTEHAYWLRLELDSRARTKPYLLHIDYPTFDDLRLTIESTVTSTQSVNGFLVAPEDKSIAHRHHLFLIPTGEVTTLWLRATNTGSFQLPLLLWDEVEFQKAQGYDMLYHGLYFGIWLALIFFNGVMLLVFKDRAFACFLGLVTSVGIFQLVALGFGADQWAAFRAVANSVMLLSIGFGMIFACLFIDKALVLKLTQPTARKTLNVLAAIVVLVLVSHSIFEYNLLVPFIAALTIPISLVVTLTSLRLAITGNRFAIYFCIAWATFFVGITIQALSRFGVINANLMTERAVSLGFIIMTTTMTIAFAVELRNRYTLRIQLDDSQGNRKLDDELTRAKERKILERMMSSRTAELEQALQELSVAHEALQEINTVDAVTGTRNRHYFDTVFSQEWKRATREGYSLSLLMLDVDHFKIINDTHGHPFGDECLKQIASRINNFLKRPADILARYGGEEFVVLLPYIENGNAERLAEQIRVEFDSSPFRIDGAEISIKLSIGLCTVIPTENDNPADIVSKADIALYEAKGAGRNQVINAGQLS
jgi:two-component system, sensor histidine kinase LadS